MACQREEIADATAVEVDMETVLVTCLVDGLQVGMFGKKLKNGTVSVKFTESGFDMEVTVVRGKNTEITVRKLVKKLPGPIVPSKCTWKVDKGKVLIRLVKAQEESWAVQLSMSGLEQDESDD